MNENIIDNPAAVVFQMVKTRAIAKFEPRPAHVDMADQMFNITESRVVFTPPGVPIHPIG